MTKYKRNKEPIKSYGFILYHIYGDQELSNEFSNLNSIKFLIQQRRETFENFDFILGKWENYDQAVSLLKFICPEEKNRYLNHTFSEIWDDLWINKNCRSYKDNYNRAKQKYDSICSDIPHIFDNITLTVMEPPWGFPKGRKNGNNNNNNNFSGSCESDYECALRETEEETRIPRNKISLPITSCNYFEEYVGSNGIHYSTTYFLAEVKEEIITKYMETPNCLRPYSVSEEVQNIKWVTYEESKNYLDHRRQVMLKDAANIIIKRNAIDSTEIKAPVHGNDIFFHEGKRHVISTDRNNIFSPSEKRHVISTDGNDINFDVNTFFKEEKGMNSKIFIENSERFGSYFEYKKNDQNSSSRFKNKFSNPKEKGKSLNLIPPSEGLNRKGLNLSSPSEDLNSFLKKKNLNLIPPSEGLNRKSLYHDEITINLQSNIIPKIIILKNPNRHPQTQ